MTRSEEIDAALRQASVYREFARYARSYGYKMLAKEYDKEAIKCERWAAKC